MPNPDPLESINLEFLPDWARQPSPTLRHYEGSAEKASRREDHRRGPPRRGHQEGGRDRREGRSEGRPPGRPGRGRRDDGPAPARRVVPPTPRPAVQVSFLPEPRALELVAEQVRATARAYPLFSLAKMFLEKAERHHVRIQSLPPTKAAAPAVLFQCSICHTVAMDRGEAIDHLLEKHRDQFYQEVREPCEPPKGNFTCVAQCRLNDALLGPPNHHAYAENLMRLYRQRFSHMSFERFKSNVTSVHDPELVKKWKEAASFKITFKALQDPEAKPLVSETEVRQHFARVHAAALLREGTTCTLEGVAVSQVKPAGLLDVIRDAREQEDRFPINLTGCLRGHFAKAGLPVFKGPRRMQFVGVARPNPLVADEQTLSPGVRAILGYLKAHPGSNRKQLIAALAAPAQPPASAPAPAEPTPAAPWLQDLHWLVRAGHIVEFHNGLMELARKPAPPPPKKKSPPSPTPPTAEKAPSQPAVEPGGAGDVIAGGDKTSPSNC